MVKYFAVSFEKTLTSLICIRFQILRLFTTDPSWRNWLARSTVNRKVGGSSPPGGVLFFLKLSLHSKEPQRNARIPSSHECSKLK